MIRSISNESYIVLYWDLPEAYVKGNFYTVFKNGKEIGKTEKCHFKADGLEAGTEYSFQVKMEGETQELIGMGVIRTDDAKRKIDVTKPPYNAVGDGKTLNTKALQAAIDDCGEGECVLVPAGDYMTGSLFLHSHMELRLEKDAIIHGTVNVDDYSPKIQSRFEGHEMMCYAGLINIGKLDRTAGFTCTDVKISGEGTVCGGGRALAQNVIDVEMVLQKDYLESLKEKINDCELPVTIPGRARPRLINMSCCNGIIIDGIGIMNGASWNVHMIYSDDIVTYGCTFRSEEVWNGDGWDPDSSSNCTLFGCEFYTGDDAVAIKSGKNPEGNVINRPSEHIRVFDCISHYGHGITVGSEMSGGVSDVRIWNCDMGDSLYGVEIKGTKKRGGYVRDVHVRCSKVCRVLIHSVGYNDDGEGAPTAPVFENCTFEDMEITARLLKRTEDFRFENDKVVSDFCAAEDAHEYCEAIELSGFDIPGHFVKNIKFKNITIDNGIESKRQSIYLQCCEGVSLENICCK